VALSASQRRIKKCGMEAGATGQCASPCSRTITGGCAITGGCVAIGLPERMQTRTSRPCCGCTRFGARACSLSWACAGTCLLPYPEDLTQPSSPRCAQISTACPVSGAAAPGRGNRHPVQCMCHGVARRVPQQPLPVIAPEESVWVCPRFLWQGVTGRDCLAARSSFRVQGLGFKPKP
jgi:hypothetical protein